jgi:conjugal transfer pilus assembly protein TraE
MEIRQTLEKAKALNVRLALTAGLLGLSVATCLVQAVLLLTSKEIVLAPTLPAALALTPGGAVPADYLEAVSRDVAYTFLNRTPETDAYFERSMEQVIEPATYQRIKAQLVDARKAREATRSSQAFFPDDVCVLAARLYVEVAGTLEESKGSDVVETTHRLYALQFVRHGSSVRLSAIGELKPEARDKDCQRLKPAMTGGA